MSLPSVDRLKKKPSHPKGRPFFFFLAPSQTLPVCSSFVFYFSFCFVSYLCLLGRLLVCWTHPRDKVLEMTKLKKADKRVWFQTYIYWVLPLPTWDIYIYIYILLALFLVVIFHYLITYLCFNILKWYLLGNN